MCSLDMRLRHTAKSRIKSFSQRKWYIRRGMEDWKPIDAENAVCTWDVVSDSPPRTKRCAQKWTGAKTRSCRESDLEAGVENKSCTSSVATVCLCDPWKPKFNYSFFNRTACPWFHLMPSIRINVTFLVRISQFQDTRVWSLWRLLYCMHLNLSNSVMI